MTLITKRPWIVRISLGCALLTLLSAATSGQTLLLEDDFNRGGGWENAMTHVALPAWSEPGGFIMPTDGTPVQAELRVDGDQIQVLVDGQIFLDLSDADLTAGKVGLMSWGQRGGSPFWGTRCETLTVLDDLDQPVLQENWELPAGSSWAAAAPMQEAGVPASALIAGGGNMRWDFLAGEWFDDTNAFAFATAAFPNTNFIGPTIVSTQAGSETWTDYQLRTRITSGDNDGAGVIVRYQDTAEQQSFYRVTFAAEEMGTGTTRAPQGVSIQKYVEDKTLGTVTWSSLAVSDPLAFVYGTDVPFDVSVTVQTVSPGETQISVDIVNDPAGAATVIPTITVSDTTDPLSAGSAGVHIWGNNPTRFSNHGGVSTPMLVTLDATPVELIGDVFPQGYNDWLSTQTGVPIAGQLPEWGIRLVDTTDAIESSDGRQVDGVGDDGQYEPYILINDAFATGTQYTYQATLKSNDNDGLGLVFGYQDNDNYFRLGLRNQSSNLGFPQGISLQKVVGGVKTPLAAVTGRGPRAGLAGIWIQKFRSSTIEMSSNAFMYDGSGQGGVEFQGPRMVRGDVAWTDYTYEAVIHAEDDDSIGLLFRFQDENNFYRLNFQSQEQTTAGAPPAGVSVQKVAGGVYTELFRDTDPLAAGDNDVTPSAGFIYPVPAAWRARVICTGGTFRIQIDGLNPETPNFYEATVVDPAPLANGKVGLHTWGHDQNEFREIKLTLAGEVDPVFTDAMGTPDPKGWVDATAEPNCTTTCMTDPAVVSGENGDGAGTPISGIGLRPDLEALGVRDNRWIDGMTFIVPGDPTRGTTDFDGPRGVAGGTHWTDYTYTIDLKALDDDGIGLLFRYRDEGNFYRLMFMNQENNAFGGPPRGVSVQKRLAGVYEELFFSNQFIYTPGESWTVEVDGQGADFTVTITQLNGDVDGDGQTQYVMVFSDPADPHLSGKIGVTTWGALGQANEVNTLLGGAGLDWTQHFNEGAVFDNVSVIGVTGRAVPDLNNDNHVDGADFILWAPCQSGPEIPISNPDPVCLLTDMDLDGDSDQTDFRWFQLCYSGPNLLDPDCVND